MLDGWRIFLGYSISAFENCHSVIECKSRIPKSLGSMPIQQWTNKKQSHISLSLGSFPLCPHRVLYFKLADIFWLVIMSTVPDCRVFSRQTDFHCRPEWNHICHFTNKPFIWIAPAQCILHTSGWSKRVGLGVLNEKMHCINTPYLTH